MAKKQDSPQLICSEQERNELYARLLIEWIKFGSERRRFSLDEMRKHSLVAVESLYVHLKETIY